MKIFTFKLLILLLFFQTAGAQDTIINYPYVGGDWTPDHNYIVNCDILVRYDSILTVYPGVKIEVRSGFSITVEGQFIANGNQNNWIEIKPYQDNSWQGITFTTPSGSNNMKTSQLSFIEIDCGNYQSSEAIMLGEHHINSINNLLVTNAETAITISGEALINDVTHCRFENVNQGIAYKFCDAVSQVLIEGCTFKNISEKAIFISDNGSYQLEDIVIEDCVFDNSNLQGNNSESSVYITYNQQLASVSLNSNVFRAFGMKDTTSVSIYIDDNENLNEVSLSHDSISFCGGGAIDQPVANFGGIYIDKCNDVFLEYNDFRNNTGWKSGVGYIQTKRIFSDNNLFQNNQNDDYDGSEYFAGAITFSVAERIEMYKDAYNSNSSAKSGGAFVILSQDNSNPIDLIFNKITLSSNVASYNGGAALINASIDTLKLSNSLLSGNSSSALGGCISLISSRINDLNIESNTIQDNFVSKIANGGFLYLTHIPENAVPAYGSFRFNHNHNTAVNHSEQNYSLFYAKINSFPGNISIIQDTIINYYPVSSSLYLMEHPLGQPYQNKDEISLTIADNYYLDNQCPVFYLANDSSTITADIHGNNVEGVEGLPGTFVNVRCNKVPELNIHNEQYIFLTDTTSRSGGCVLFRTFKEIGRVEIESVESRDCYSVSGNGGHISLISGSSDPSMTQKLIIKNSSFNNSIDNKTTGGNGGAVYYDSPGNIDSLLVQYCDFADLYVDGSGGALFINAKEINDVSLQGSYFSDNYAANIAGAIYLNAGNGSIKRLSLTPYIDQVTFFTFCFGVLGGGAMYAKASKEIGPVILESVESHGCHTANGNGGSVCLLSMSSDASISQDLILNNCIFDEGSGLEPYHCNGGAIYYSTPGNLDTLSIRSCGFSGMDIFGTGGALFVDAKEINLVSILGSDFSGNVSIEADAGALYVNASNGGIKGLSIKPFINHPTSFNGCSSLNNGGAVFLKASKEIGPVLLDSVSFVNCNAIEGNGGHLAFISGSSDPAQSQNLIIKNSTFTNTNIITGGNGGAVSFNSPGNLDTLLVRESQFSGMKANESGGAIFIDTKEISGVKIFGSHFTSNSSVNSKGGAICINAGDGDVKNLWITPYSDDTTNFTSCTSKTGGGAVYIKASKEIGPAFFESVKSENCYSSIGDGGQFAMISNGSDPSLGQKLIIISSSFSNTNNLSGGNGGAVYFDSPGNLLDSLFIRSSLFSNLNTKKKAGAIFVDAKEINSVSILGSHFSLNSSTDSVAGSVFVNAGNGNINNLLITPYNGLTTTFTSCSSKLSGGALYFNASNEIGVSLMDSVLFDNCHAAAGNGGSIFMSSDKLASITLSSSLFNGSFSGQSGGAVYLKSKNGFLNGAFSSNKFLNCTSQLMGGVFFIEDNKFDNNAENLSWSANKYRKESGGIKPEMGGTIYCKGIKSVSIIGDSVLNQSASAKGGFLYMEKVYTSVLEGVYANNNTAGKGGVIYHQGDQSNTIESSGIFNSNFLFNKADVTGGCFYLTDIDSINVGKPGNTNVFVANQSLQESNNDASVGGGIFYLKNANNVNLNTNSFYVNNSLNNGGTGIIDNVTASLIIENNIFLTNKARIGGTFTFLNTIADGLIANNKFYHNSSTLFGGALFFFESPTDNIEIRDNTFYNNSTSISGGAVSSYRPLKLIRNLFRENKINVKDPLNNNGTAVSLNDNGIQSVIKNCVFDKNSGKIDSVASIYFDNYASALADQSIANCTFFNHSEKFRSVYNASDQDTVHVINSIFDIKAKSSRLDVKYFNETVKARYCDMIHSRDTTNHNYDEYFVFNNGDYYFDSLQPAPFDTVQSFPIDKGDPDPAFYDEHLPAGYWAKTNDLGISGGPDNPDSSGTFLFQEPPNLPAKFFVVVKSSHCFDYSFECLGDSIEKYDYFYWFMPDTIIKTQDSIPRKLDYTFSQDAEDNLLITVLGHASGNIDIFGYGQDTVNLDIIRIDSLNSSAGNNTISVPSTPYTFSILADIYVAGNAGSYTSQWNVLSSQGVEFEKIPSLTTCAFELRKMTESSGSIEVEYLLSACGRTRRKTIEIQLTTINWGYPEISFYPPVDDVPNTTDSIEVKFNYRMTDISGTACEDLIPESYIITSDPCPDIEFNMRVVCGPNETRFILIPVDITTQNPTTLCDGEYSITVLGHDLFTANYQLPGVDTLKPYFLDIDDIPGNGYIMEYPNPFRDKIHIEFISKADYLIKITDLTGHVERCYEFDNISEVILNLEDLSDGMHMLHVENSRGPQYMIIKIIKITH
jgi:hypothetical protein